MKNPLANIKISTKIYSGFGASFLILVVVMGLSFTGLQSINKEFKMFQNFVTDVDVVAQLQTDIFKTQKAALMWLKTQDPETLEEILEDKKHVNEDIEYIKKAIQNPERLAEVHKIEEAFGTFQHGIEYAKIFMLERNEAVNTMNAVGPEIDAAISKIYKEETGNGNYQTASYAGMAQKEFMESRLNGAKFLVTNKVSDKEEFEKSFNRFTERLDDMKRNVASLQHQKALQDLSNLAPQYYKAFDQAQAIVIKRNILIEDEIVGAGVLIANSSAKIQESVSADREVVSQELAQINKSVMEKTTIAGAIGLILAALSAFFIPRQILIPINAVRGALVALSQGRLREDIPYTSMKDEIGEMSRALAEFKEESILAIQSKNAMDAASSCVMMSDENLNIIYMNESLLKMMRAAESDIKTELPNFDANNLVGVNIDSFHKDPSHQRGMLANLQKSYNTSISVGGRTFNLLASPIFSKNEDRIGYSVEWIDKTAEIGVSGEIEDMITAAGRGDLTNRITLEGKNGFFRSVSEGVNNMAEVMQSVANDLASNLQSLSNGDLTTRITAEYEGIFGQLKDDYNGTSERLAGIVGSIKDISLDVGASSDDMAETSNGLSNRAEQQASTLEETAASMEELTSTVKANADNAKEANTAAINTRTVAEKGSQVANEAGEAMEKINDSSKKITEIINVIDEIAFQTNLLALNAAVEAARAGDAGRGFAVVAQEVRTLAQRSAQSSKDIKALIDDSSKQVGEGVDLVNTAVESLQEIYDSIEGVAGLVGQIASASTEQATSLDELNQAVMEMDTMTQENASMAQQSKLTAEGMQNKSGELGEVVSYFQLDENATRAAPKAKPQAKSSVIPLSTSSSAHPPAANADLPVKPKKAMGDQSADNDTDWKEF